jgi:hypothetical protein
LPTYVHIAGKRGKGAVAGTGKGSQIGQLTLGKEPAEMGIRSLVQGAIIRIRDIFLSTDINYGSLCNTVILSVQVKNKPRDAGS